MRMKTKTKTVLFIQYYLWPGEPSVTSCFLTLTSAARSIGYYLSIHIKKLDVLISVCVCAKK